MFPTIKCLNFRIKDSIHFSSAHIVYIVWQIQMKRSGSVINESILWMWQGVWYHLRPALRLFVNTVIIIRKVEKKEVSHCSINSAHSILVSSPYYFLDSRIFTTISLWTTVVVFIHFIFNLTTVIKRWIIVFDILISFCSIMYYKSFCWDFRFEE